MWVEIEGVDVRKGVDMSGGLLDLYIETLAVFHGDGVMKIDEINTCLETNNLSLYAIYVHALKSAAASIGAEKLSETAKTLEIAGDQEDLNFIQKHNEQFLSDLTRLLNNIEDALSAYGDHKS